MKQIEITAKQERSAFNSVLSYTGQYAQVLKQFDGIYDCVLHDKDGHAITDGLTVEVFMSYLGAERFKKVYKNGTVRKEGYTPGTVNKAWADEMLAKSSDGKVVSNFIYKNVSAKIMQVGEDGKSRAYRVYASEKEALAEDGKAISRYQLVEVPKDKWSVRTVLTGLKQSKHIADEKKKAQKSAEAWDAVAECWIVINKGTVRMAKKVDKKSVVF